MIPLRIWLWVNFHTTLLSDIYNRAEIDFYNCQSVQMQMNYDAARHNISHIIFKIVNNALLKMQILHIKQNQEYSINYIIKSPVYLRKITFKSVTICIVICYFVILQFCQFDILKI